MIVIRVQLQVKPENQRDFVEFMTDSIVLSNQYEGCVKFDLYRDLQEKNGFLLYEEWETLSHFNTYRESEHFKESGNVLFPMMMGEPDTAYFEAQAIQ